MYMTIYNLLKIQGTNRNKTPQIANITKLYFIDQPFGAKRQLNLSHNEGI